MGNIAKADIDGLVTRINAIRKKHGMTQPAVAINATTPYASEMNTVVTRMKEMTASKYIASVNAATVAQGGVMNQSYIDGLSTELTRLNNICTHDGSNNGSYNSSYDGSYDGSYKGSNYSSYDGSYKGSYNSSYKGSNNGSDYKTYYGSVCYSGDASYSCSNWCYGDCKVY